MTDGELVALATLPATRTKQNALVAELRAHRTREQQARGLLDALRKLHAPFPIYDDCGHDHESDGGGVVEVEGVGLTCAFLYNVCAHCCTDGGEESQGMTCADGHTHGPGKPICATAAAVAIYAKEAGS